MLMGLCKGSSSQCDLDAGAASCHMLMPGLQARGWLEYVESNANWSDGASRRLHEDPWIIKEGFLVQEAQVPLWLWMTEPSQGCAEILKTLQAQESNGWQ